MAAHDSNTETLDSEGLNSMPMGPTNT